ncbi:MAG: HAMP domain-containing histidine kinase [Bacteroidetes bacterium]|nr:MAG: HAMP domain-containing histidine kinase [Bacteroidota bacterium]
MADTFFTLIPERIQYDQFWIELKKRNHWLIMLRYGAVVMQISLIIFLYILDNVMPRFGFNSLPLWIITAVIFGYNIVFHRISIAMPELYQSQKKFHSLHLSMLQIILDIIALMLFIYFTGGVESPIFFFYIFHVIIGSLFLTDRIMAIIVSWVMLTSIAGALMEYNHIIPHQGIAGIHVFPLYNNTSFMVGHFIFFGLTLYLSIYLTNSIAKQLYQRERSLTQAYNDLENAEKSKSRYVFSVVHDLKTPIAASMTYLDMMLDGTLGEVRSEHLRPLERIKYRLSGAVKTINDILFFSKLKLESGINNISEVSLISVFDEIYLDHRILINTKNIKYTFNCDSGDDAIIQAEPKLLQLALSNLVSNAIKYTEQDGIIEVVINDLKELYLISIADNGIGIPAEEKEKIFQDFYRTSLSKKKGIEGTGLGMSIVLQVIQKLHGEILVESPCYLATDENRPGTRFIVRLPKIYSAL